MADCRHFCGALSFGYGIAAEDMEPDFKLKISGKNRKLDIAIFRPNTEHTVTHKFIIEKKLGRGSFGVVYEVIDTLGDVARTVKLIISDRHSTLDRLKKEYRHLVHIWLSAALGAVTYWCQNCWMSR